MFGEGIIDEGSTVRVLLCSLVLSALFPALVQAQLTTTGAVQISVGQGNTAPQEPFTGGFGGSNAPVAPPNGNFVVFSSRASNLSSTTDTNGVFDIYRYTEVGTTELISVATSNTAPSGQLSYGSFSPAVSPMFVDGSYAVAFASDATDLVANYKAGGVSSPVPQIFVRFPTVGLTVLISKPAGRTDNQGANDRSDQPTITITGNSPKRYAVCFRSYATNITNSGNNRNFHPNIFCTQVTLSDAGEASVDTISEIKQSPDGSLENPVLSGDGKFLVFSSSATILPGVKNGETQIYRYQFQKPTDAFTLISKTAADAPNTQDSSEPSISFAGESITFKTQANGAIKGLENNAKAILVLYNAKTGVHTQLNTNAANEASNGEVGSGRIDPRTRFAVFSDNGTNLSGTPESSNGKYQTYLKDLKSGKVIRTSVTAADTQVAGDDDSGKRDEDYQAFPITIGGVGYNSRSIFTSFISVARNFGGPGAPSKLDKPYTYIPYLFSSDVTLPPRTLFRNAPLETPPDVTITKRRTDGSVDIRLDLQSFTLSEENSASLERILQASSGARAKYTIEIKKAGSKKRTIRVTSRNSATIRKLSAGRYTIRYRVSGTIKKKTVKSRYSAKATVVIS